MSTKYTRNDYKVFYPMQTRWADNDIYGHINNVQYYAYFDTAVNRYLIEEGGLNIHSDAVVGFVVESKCQYFSAIAYPQSLQIGLRVSRLGNSSVTYEIGIFVEGESSPSAQGHFVHVFVEQQTNKSTAIPLNILEALKLIQVE
ncbi:MULTISPECIES: acyl-CoA thioesterase [Aliiglaciecola]|uniref:acyl-CoA thioesterase n=1 Tax=Aliiglaciecola TaxID=1406885 RepID=UPI001C08F004|nr:MULTISPECIES: thioesterase family protein [Aliiglaciecola]MBU2879121.1 acyl-CoA thioesterase [Aliiglaciecola lipolytica]MDO6710819.1 thioesterase family protein [Aliiglaciecola sp. 2_MG-2023]MDO6751773.1 thioesterase family protein [Aliiglaciecola sp. 1_MG-2023]